MKKAKLIKVSFIPTDNTVAAIIYALVDDIIFLNIYSLQ